MSQDIADDPEQKLHTESQMPDSDDDGPAKVYAVKIIQKAKFHHMNRRDVRQMLSTELETLQKLTLHKDVSTGSDHVVDLIDIFEDRNKLYFVTDYIRDTLWDEIDTSYFQSPDDKLTPNDDQKTSAMKPA